MEEMPVFVKIEDYKNIVDVLHLMKEKLEIAKKLLAQVEDFKKQEDTELAAWEAELEDIDERVEGISKTLLEPEM
ncbi:hypothetical protein J4410_03425 [Candidatus Woesearchaeota archaeon]|nr:hypothetical protein [Candidatus Woesearchaeota archaeon]